jgi:hypothetical protein
VKAVARCRDFANENDRMDEPVTPEPEEQPKRPTTAPNNFTISARAFDSAERAQKLDSLVWAFIQELSRQFDLSRLDAVTVAHDYARRCVTSPALPSLSQGDQCRQCVAWPALAWRFPLARQSIVPL